MTPDIAALLESFGPELVFAQVLIQRAQRGFDLRHVDDREVAGDALELVALETLRDIAHYTSKKAFRPLKSAPDLRRGWRANAADGEALGLGLGALYPGAVADWYAIRTGQPSITGYRQFTHRQTGMYRITTHLNDVVAGAAIRACCHADFCLKRRLWTVEGLSPDGTDEKSLIPCLEPCAIMLEFARQVARWEQGLETDADRTDDGRRARFLEEKRGSLPHSTK